MEIALHFDRRYCEEFFFRNGNEKIFLSPTVKKETYATVAIAMVLLVFSVISIITDSAWGFVYFFSIVLAIALFQLIMKVVAILKWRKSIKDFLDKAAKYESHKIILSENAFTLINDTTEHIERWSEFKKAEMDEHFVFLFGSQNYLFPKKAMTAEEFELFKSEIRNRIRNK